MLKNRDGSRVPRFKLANADDIAFSRADRKVAAQSIAERQVTNPSLSADALHRAYMILHDLICFHLRTSR